MHYIWKQRVAFQCQPELLVAHLVHGHLPQKQNRDHARRHLGQQHHKSPDESRRYYVFHGQFRQNWSRKNDYNPCYGLPTRWNVERVRLATHLPQSIPRRLSSHFSLRIIYLQNETFLFRLIFRFLLKRPFAGKIRLLNSQCPVISSHVSK